ncbi:MAG: Wzz protein [Thermodesulfobacteriota bacterium]|nr:Wzz protein [Thermodesulfobacteriota bacterium]
MEKDQEFTVRDLANIIYRRIWILRLVMILFPLGVLIACLLATRVYETTAKVVITAKQVSQSLMASPTGPGPAQVMNLNVDEMDLNTEMEILRSLDLWEQTVRALGPELLKPSSPGILSSLGKAVGDLFGDSTPQQIDQAEQADKTQRVKNVAKSLIANFEAIPTPKSKVLDLSLRYPDPNMVQRILNTLLEKYIPYHLAVYSVPGVESFLADQLKEAKQAHEKANNDLTEFRKRWNLALPDRQKAEIITMMKTLDDALIEANSNLKQIEEMLNIVRAGGAVSGQLSQNRLGFGTP